MGDPPGSELTDAQIERELARERVDAGYVLVIRDYLSDPADAWRQCCGSNCDPCILRLGVVVDRLRRLGYGPGG